MTSRREDEFPFIVSSDGCRDAYPENTPSNFKIILKDPIEFGADEDWEVGLRDFHYPYSWYNVSSDMVLLYIKDNEIVRVEFPDWQCTNVVDLTKYIHDKLSLLYDVGVDHFGRFQMIAKGVRCDVGFSIGLISLLGISEFDETVTITSFMRRAEHHKVLAEFWKDGVNPMMVDEDLFVIDWTSTKNDEVMNVLKEYLDFEKMQNSTRFNEYPVEKVEVIKDYGLDSEQAQRNTALFLNNFKALYGGEDFPEKAIVGEYMPRLNPALQLHIHSNIVQPVDMNDTTTNLMRVVNIKGAPGMMTQEVFFQPTYQPVEKRRKISMIHVYIKNEAGKFVPFVGGQVLMTLHFRRQRYRR